MKNQLFIIFISFFSIMSFNAQTLYVPGGSSGIGTSSNGNVGIGTATTSPTEKLQIGNLNNTENLKLIIPGVYNFEQVKLGQYGNGSCGLELVNHAGPNSSYGVRLFSNLDNGIVGLQIQTADPTTTYQGLNYVTRLAVATNGNVGIGNISPQYKLDVLGDARVSWSVFTNEIHFIANDLGAGIDNTDPYTLRKVHDAQNVSHLDLNLNDDVDESFRIYGNSCVGYSCGTYSGNLYHSFDASGNVFHAGNVGIGCNPNSSYKLNVNGIIHAIEVKVDLDGFADYVFNPTYKLMPLHEVEQYVNINSHLPEMPSAAEVSKNGLSVGEMQNKLLKKVEELTLYVIEQQKTISQQSVQISQQNIKIEELEKKMK